MSDYENDHDQDSCEEGHCTSQKTKLAPTLDPKQVSYAKKLHRNMTGWGLKEKDATVGSSKILYFRGDQFLPLLAKNIVTVSEISHDYFQSRVTEESAPAFLKQ